MYFQHPILPYMEKRLQHGWLLPGLCWAGLEFAGTQDITVALT